MTIKSFLLTVVISVSALTAAETVDVAVKANPELSRLVQAYSDSADATSVMNLRSYVKSLQPEIYHLVDLGKMDEATAKFDSVIELLTPIYDSMSDEDRWRAGEETLGLIGDYISMHSPQSE